MTYKTLLLEKQDGITIIKMNTPHNLNAISQQSVEDLFAVLQVIKNDDNCRVVILTGEGKGFIGGADIKHMTGLDAIEGGQFCFAVSKCTLEMEKMGKVFIAAVNGFALGAGLEVALGCDIRIFSKHAKIGFPETGLGVIPGAGGAQRLQRLVGIGKASEIIFTGDIISADDALRFGITNQVTEPESLMDTAMSMAEKILTKSPVGTRLAKEALQKGRDTDLEKALEYDKNLFGLCFSTEDKKEGMAAFIEKRKPVFK